VDNIKSMCSGTHINSRNTFINTYLISTREPYC
jgi:hypothetical protein